MSISVLIMGIRRKYQKQQQRIKISYTSQCTFEILTCSPNIRRALISHTETPPTLRITLSYATSSSMETTIQLHVRQYFLDYASVEYFGLNWAQYQTLVIMKCHQMLEPKLI